LHQALVVAEFRAARSVVRHDLFNKIPKSLRVIEFANMAKFVDDNVIREVRRQKCDLIIEVEIPRLGTTSPSGALCADRNLSKLEMIELIEVRKSCMNERSRSLFIFLIS
jgi:hypothetical protein